MPFNEQGMTPDIIINPHAIPSRMTINQLMETVLGKSCCFNGHIGDGSPFNEINSVDKIISLLEQCNFQSINKKNNVQFDKFSLETLRSPVTGKKLMLKYLWDQPIIKDLNIWFLIKCMLELLEPLLKT